MWPFEDDAWKTLSPFRDLPLRHFGLIYADPPWRFQTRTPEGEGKSPQQHYACMDLPAIQALPVEALAAPDCALALWATAPMLPEALSTLSAWGFEYKTCAAWAKLSRTGVAWGFGTGFIFRSAAEFLLIGTRGQPPVLNRSTRNLFVERLREHSRKPDTVRDVLAGLFPGPKVELFARETIPGWRAWGAELHKFSAHNQLTDN